MFEIQDEKYIPLLDINAQIYEDEHFKCKHIHLDSKSNEKVFMVAFRTIPSDSSGVAHILEHTALCGSEKYPVRDPFFMMIRRSLNTFMNAFTSSDWTAYPFATLNDKDFKNLLGVYLDSSFFPKLDMLDFAQEGHRLEFSDKDNIESEIQIKGVVFNEMKGAMSSVTSQLWHGLSKNLYTSSTYKHNSGGNPENIIDLTHEDLVSFHKKHYHPSNATFFTFGKISPKEIQDYIHANVLNKFTPSLEEIAVKNEKRISEPKVAYDFYNPQPGDENNHHVVLSWLLKESHNPIELLESYLMSSILLDNSASPLRKILENTNLGKSLSPLTGLEADQKELVFAVGLEGVESNKHMEVEKLVFDCLNDLTENGIPKELVMSSLHQLEIKQREITGSGMPFGLQVMLSCLPACIHNDNPLNILDLDSAFNSIKDNLNKENYIESLISKNLIENNHRVNYSLIPDVNFNKKIEKKIQDKLDKYTNTLSIDDKNKIAYIAKSLEKRQSQVDDPEILPKVTKSDIPLKRSYISPNKSDANYFYKTGTNGLVYHSMIFPCKSLTKNELEISSLFSDNITNIGLGSESYELIQKKQSLISGGISASFSVIPDETNKNYQLALKISSKCLKGNENQMQDLMLKTIQESNFNESERIQELLGFISANNEKSIIQNGHILSMSSAAAQINNIASTNDFTGGIRFISNTSSLYKNITKEKNIDSYIDSLQAIKSKISNDPIYTFIASSIDLQDLKIKSDFDKNSNFEKILFLESQKDSYAWITGSQVCFCAEAFPSVDIDHNDSAALTVLGAVLRNGYLHSAIREKGGAYGAGASQDSKNKTFKFFSYRDPNCIETFNEFKRSIDWGISNIKTSHLDEGILGVISSIDKPLSPFGEAMNDFSSELDNRSQEARLNFRSRVKKCSVKDLQYVCEKYLLNNSKKSAIAGESYIDQLKELNLKIKEV